MILAILQARMSSTRCPGKVLRPILGRPMLFHQVERIRQSKKISELVIATSTSSSDDEIESRCAEFGLKCYRGDLNDVLDRFYQVSLSHPSEHIVRLTGDCPLADPDVIDSLIQLHLDGGYDYSSNALERTFPHGLDAEIMKTSVLREAWKEARSSFEREHVTPWIYRTHASRLKIGSLKNETDLSSIRLTVDWEEDFRLVSEIYSGLYLDNSEFRTRDVLNYLRLRPELEKINGHRREKRD